MKSILLAVMLLPMRGFAAPRTLEFKRNGNLVRSFSLAELRAGKLGPIKRGDKEIDPGPFYLVWSNFKETDHAAYSDVLKWPYQLVEINVKDTAQ